MLLRLLALSALLAAPRADSAAVDQFEDAEGLRGTDQRHDAPKPPRPIRPPRHPRADSAAVDQFEDAEGLRGTGIPHGLAVVAASITALATDDGATPGIRANNLPLKLNQNEDPWSSTFSITLPAVEGNEIRYGMCAKGATSASAQASGITYSLQEGFKSGDKVWGNRSYVFSGVEETPCAGGTHFLPNTYAVNGGTEISVTLDWSGDTELSYCMFVTDSNAAGMTTSMPAAGFTLSQVEGFSGAGRYGSTTYTHVFNNWMCIAWPAIPGV